MRCPIFGRKIRVQAGDQINIGDMRSFGQVAVQCGKMDGDEADTPTL